jgi:hypothetical protein
MAEPRCAALRTKLLSRVGGQSKDCYAAETLLGPSSLAAIAWRPASRNRLSRASEHALLEQAVALAPQIACLWLGETACLCQIRSESSLQLDFVVPEAMRANLRSQAPSQSLRGRLKGIDEPR